MSRNVSSRSRSTRKSGQSLVETLERRSLMSATISGAVMQDLSGNGLSADDKPLSGIVVKLYQDKNGNGAVDSADGAALASKTSAAATGAFSFTNLGIGKYLLQETPGANQVRTAPTLSNTIAVNVLKKNVTYGNNVFANYVKSFDRAAVTNISYTINGTKTVTTLNGNVKQGDVVTANFTVKAGKTVELSLVAYKANAPFSSAQNLQYQKISDLATGTFSAGKHCMTVCVPDCYFQVDFVGGKAIDPFGPAGSNILYGAQDRLISYANGGTKPCDCEPEHDHAEGRMTGGGSIFLPGGAIGGATGTRVTHGFQLHCAQNSKTGGPIQDVNNRLEINWNQSKFHLASLSSVECFDTAIVQAPPKSAPIDTLQGVGNGRFSGAFNGRSYKMVDAKIEFTLTDGGPTRGEPGRDDTSDYRIIVLDGNQDGVANDPVVVLDTNGPVKLTFGNHQAHTEITPLVRAAENMDLLA
ncbi:MAG TPA: prealbumin-like fold domain-containing protein [Tepidisphaeraceae bacterium]|nr:prealbumin-like fold domain-containing protein [Tepidisphaeraceae bacterium]